MPENKQLLETTVAVILTKVEYIEKKVEQIEKRIERDYVTKEEFDPIKRVVFGVVGLILLAVVAAVVGLVIK